MVQTSDGASRQARPSLARRSRAAPLARRGPERRRAASSPRPTPTIPTASSTTSTTPSTARCASCTTSCATPDAAPFPRRSRTWSSTAPAASWSPWSWALASAPKAATSPSSASSRLPPPGPGPLAALARRRPVLAPGRQRNLPHRHRGQHQGHRALSERRLRLPPHLRRRRVAPRQPRVNPFVAPASRPAVAGVSRPPRSRIAIRRQPNSPAPRSRPCTCSPIRC